MQLSGLASIVLISTTSLAGAAAVPPGACKIAANPNEAHLLASGAAPANPLLFELGQAEWIVEDEFIVEFGIEAAFSLESTRLGGDGRTGLAILDATCERH